jgi:hypothetical protein
MQTDRDAEIVDWIGRLGAGGAEHTMYRFEMSRSVAYDRLGTLVRDGLLEHHAILYAHPGMYVATPAGLRWQGNERLGRYSLSPSGFEHAWQLARVAVEIEAMGDWDLLSEREIRAAELDAGQPFASARVGTIADRPALHRPDLALTTTTGRIVCIEVELSIKSASRLAAICRGWTRARHIEHVYYLAAPGPARAVQRAVRSTHAANRISVLGLDETAAVAEGIESRSEVLDALQEANR